MTIYDMFFRFLKYNNILHLYKKNLSNKNKIATLENVDIKPGLYMILFDFVETNEGFDFWNNIDRIWYHKILRKLKLNDKNRYYGLNELETKTFYSLLKEHKL